MFKKVLACATGIIMLSKYRRQQQNLALMRLTWWWILLSLMSGYCVKKF